LLLAETLKSREGWHLFLYPFAGRQVHMGLAGIMAWRAAQSQPNTFSIAINDYGFELLSAKPMEWAKILPDILSLRKGAVQGTSNGEAELLAEVLASLNATELARRRFREIARIAGLIFQSHPGEKRSNRQLQASASLYYDVFQNYDPGNRLLQQAKSELLQQELDIDRMVKSLERMQMQELQIVALKRPTPLSFPLIAERFREKLSNEALVSRIARMVEELEESAQLGHTTTAGKKVKEAKLASTRQEISHMLAANSGTLKLPSQIKNGFYNAADTIGSSSPKRRSRASRRRRI
jgi:ATP-dependent Lhr-like helicase